MTDYLLEVTRVCGRGEKEQSACRYISVMTAMALPIAILPVLFCEPLTACLILCLVSDTVCDQERNYHIFFQLLQAREDPQLKDLGIGAPEVGSTLELANCSNESQEIRF